MGKRGPAKTPTPILKARGSWLAATRNGEPQPDNGEPPCPEWLAAAALDAWQYLAPKLEAMGVLTRIDGNALSRYCELWGRWQKAADFLREHGDVYPAKDAEGRVTGFEQWPQVNIVAKLGGELHRLEQQFGLTPASRAGLSISANHGKDKDKGRARFFSAG